MPQRPDRMELVPASPKRKRRRSHRGMAEIQPAPVSDTIQPESVAPDHQTNAINPPPFDELAALPGAKPESGVRLKAEASKRVFDPSVRWRNEAKAALADLEKAEDDWEKRLHLIKLANFIAEARFPEGDPRQGEVTDGYLRRILVSATDSSQKRESPATVENEIVRKAEGILREK